MVDVLGHVAMGLLWAVPAWFLWEKRTSLAFIGLVLLTVMLPDVDLYLPGIVHHGVTHTVLFVSLTALLGGAMVTTVATPVFRRLLRRSRDDSVSTGTIYGFVVSGLLLGGLSHLFIDMLSAGSGGNPPLEPFWPVFTRSFSIDFIYYSSFRWNGGLLLVALLVHATLFFLDVGPTARSHQASHSK